MTEKQYTSFYKNHSTTMVYFCMNRLIEKLLAEDIVAESFLKLWKRIEDFNDTAAAKNWMYITISNASQNANKHTRIKNEVVYIDFGLWKGGLGGQEGESAPYENDQFISDEDLEADIIKADLVQKIIVSLKSLPEKRRQIFFMKMEGYSGVEIAKELNLSPDTCRVQISRAMAFCKKLKQGFQ